MKTLRFSQFIKESQEAPLNAAEIKARLGQLGLRPERQIDPNDTTTWHGLHSECCGAPYYGEDGRCSRCGDHSTPIEADPEFGEPVYQDTNESQDKIEKRLRELGLAPNPKDITIQGFMKMLKAEYKEYLDSIRHEDDWMGLWDFYSENARGYEREYGIVLNRDTDELEYTWSNTNYSDDDDFEDTLYEGDEDQNKIEDRLRDLGLAPKKEFDDRWDEMLDEWGQDPEINRAIYTLKMKTSQIINKHIDFSDPEDEQEWERRQEWIFEQGIDDIGWFEYMIATGEL